MSEFRMPSLGADMEAGTLVEWMKKPGDRIRRGEAIAAVETQKGAIEVEAFEDGLLEEIRVPLGERVPVGTVLAIIRGDNEAPAMPAAVPQSAVLAPAAPAAPTPAPAPPVVPAPVAVSVSEVLPSQPAHAPSFRISPAASRRALELGLDPSRLRPGADGTIGLREVEAAAAGAPAASAITVPRAGPPASKPAASKAGIDPVEMRKAIAAAMARSWREIPHYFVSSIVDLEPMLAWLATDNARKPMTERLHYAVPLMRAIMRSLKEVPELNGHYGDQGFVASAPIHLGVAVAMRGGGLIAPAILDADQLPLPALMDRLNDLVARVRSGRLRSSEMTAGTITLTNLGEETADAVQPVIYPPQVAIIGCGQVLSRVLATGGDIGIRRSMNVTVGGDHRVSDGRAAARFLHRLGELLQDPEHL